MDDGFSSDDLAFWESQGGNAPIAAVDSGGVDWYQWAGLAATSALAYQSNIKSTSVGNDATVSSRAGVATKDGSPVSAPAGGTMAGLSQSTMLMIAAAVVLLLVMVRR